MCCNKHLTLVEREMILKFRATGCSITEIAQRLGRNKATVSRELQRNSINGEYIPAVAEEIYQEHRMKCRRHKILENPETFEYVKDKFLNHQWSPEEIQGRLKLEHASMQISYVTINRAIYSGVFNEPGLSHGNRGAVRKLRHRRMDAHRSWHCPLSLRTRIASFCSLRLQDFLGPDPHSISVSLPASAMTVANVSCGMHLSRS